MHTNEEGHNFKVGGGRQSDYCIYNYKKQVLISTPEGLSTGCSPFRNYICYFNRFLATLCPGSEVKRKMPKPLPNDLYSIPLPSKLPYIFKQKFAPVGAISHRGVQGVSQRYSPPLELNPKGLGKKQKYCYKLY